MPSMWQTQTARAAATTVIVNSLGNGEPDSFLRHRLQLQMRPAQQLMQARRSLSLSSRVPAPFLQSRSRTESGAASQCRQVATVLEMHCFRLRGGSVTWRSHALRIMSRNWRKRAWHC